MAEAAVKNIKAIITRCSKEGENIKLAIAAWRNMARTDGVSLSQLFYGRRQRQLLPLTGEQAKSQASSTAGRDKTAGDSEQLRNRHTKEHTELHNEDKVWMQHHITGKWDMTVQVIRKRKDGNSYVVSAPDGNTYIRGRRLLKPISSPNTTSEDTSEETQQMCPKKSWLGDCLSPGPCSSMARLPWGCSLLPKPISI